MWTETERAEFEQLLELAEKNISTEWEQEFIDSLITQAANPLWSPTERQMEKLEELAGAAAPF